MTNKIEVGDLVVEQLSETDTMIVLTEKYGKCFHGWILEENDEPTHTTEDEQYKEDDYSVDPKDCIIIEKRNTIMS